MAKPTYYPDWATDDVNLPATGQANKVRTRDIIRTTGWDKGQIPTAEEVNWQFNTIGKWIRFLTDESLPTYLPNTGTKINFAGDLTGTALWNGNKEITANIQVVDNSHKHLSADISDATHLATPNTLIKRDSAGSIYAGDIISRGSNTVDNPTFFLQTYDGRNTGSIDSNNSLGSALTINRIRSDNLNISANIALWDDGHVDISNPRSSTAQEGAPNSLLRYDYFVNINNNVNNSIGNVNNDLQSYKTYVGNAYVADIRLGSTYTKVLNGAVNPAMADGGGVMIGWYTEGSSPGGDTIYFKPIQKFVGGNWYTVGQL